MPDWVSVILLGIIEGLTEFIPVSSTGHLIIAEQFLPRQSDLFNIVIQSGAVVAVIPLFRRRCMEMAAGWKNPPADNDLLKVAAAFGLTGAGGLVLDRMNYRLPEKALPVAWALLAVGILFVVVERWLKGRRSHERITWAMVAVVAAGQLAAAVFPGTSRSGATILLLLMMGLSRPAATEFSFLVGIPTLLAAGGLKMFHAFSSPAAQPEPWGMVFLGTAVSAIVSFVAVKWLLRYVQTHTFTAFGWYRIVLALVLIGLTFVWQP